MHIIEQEGTGGKNLKIGKEVSKYGPCPVLSLRNLTNHFTTFLSFQPKSLLQIFTVPICFLRKYSRIISEGIRHFTIGTPLINLKMSTQRGAMLLQ